ncbi:hypothetical protein GCM10010185_38000 [Saccharothrix coeruleofusca]|uniref:DUF998 domain-containing protein n=1 Tax=Saccharothrix coeruleofusca TaxID=33919 RepID=A0A918ANT5_9PSEU|nr:hypothetical protein GCM10010185_38000 [Saccharothrix coeruleofusca]
MLGSLFPIVYLHFTSADVMNPIRHTVSDYTAVPDGTALLAVAALSLAVGSLVLRTRLVAAGLPRWGAAAVLIDLWAAALVVAAVFPTDPIGTPTSPSGLVHRYAGAVMFASLPLAGWLISRRFLPSPVVRRFSVAAVGTSGAFLLSHLALVAPGNDAVLLGLFERVLFAVLYGLLFALAREVSA